MVLLLPEYAAFDMLIDSSERIGLLIKLILEIWDQQSKKKQQATPTHGLTMEDVD